MDSGKAAGLRQQYGVAPRYESIAPCFCSGDLLTFRRPAAYLCERMTLPGNGVRGGSSLRTKPIFRNIRSSSENV